MGVGRLESQKSIQTNTYIHKKSNSNHNNNNNSNDGDDILNLDDHDHGNHDRPSTSLGSRHTADYFTGQMDFIKHLTDMVESLRFIDRPLRTEKLQQWLSKYNDEPWKFGWDPCLSAGEPIYRITKIIVDDCRVFRTKVC